MLFSVLAVAQAAIVLGWPCQRLNWAWRNVWTTCGLNAVTPISTAPSGTLPSMNAMSSATGVAYQLDPTGVFIPSSPNAPQLCLTGPNAGGSMMRNRCRRMLDTYGNLVFLCKTPSKGLPPNNAIPNTLGSDYQPMAIQQPHASNALALAFQAQSCLTPGPNFPTTATTCPGLMGWFTVVWNTCGFSMAPGWGTPQGVPNYTPLTSPSAGLTFTSPLTLCAATPNAATSITGFNARGPIFRSTRCRRALDQFGRTSSRCSMTPNGVVTPNAVGSFDVLRGLATSLAGAAPYCGL